MTTNSAPCAFGTDLYGVIFEEPTARHGMTPTLRTGVVEALLEFRGRFGELHVFSKLAPGIQSEVLGLLQLIDLPRQVGIPDSYWHFCATRQEKVAIINSSVCWYVDDRPEILAAIGGHVRGILFANGRNYSSPVQWPVVSSWSALSEYVARYS